MKIFADRIALKLLFKKNHGKTTYIPRFFRDALYIKTRSSLKLYLQNLMYRSINGIKPTNQEKKLFTNKSDLNVEPSKPYLKSINYEI